VQGRNASRFFSLCARYGIGLWKLRSKGENTYSGYLLLKDFYRLRPLRKKTRVSVTITGRHGLRFLLYRYRTRKALGVAVLGVATGLVLLSGRIWRIEIVGNASLGEDAILSYLEEKQIAYGISRDAIDNDALELSLRQDFDEVIWASVYEEGTKLVVCMQEKIATADESEENACMDLVATEDATIASIITRSGLAAVKTGDEVKAGDILVNGRQEILDDNGEVAEYFYKSADADVLGYATHDYEDWIDETQITSSETGNTHMRYTLSIFDVKFTSPKLYADFDSFETTEETNQLCLLQSFYLPVYWGRICEQELQNSVEEVSLSEAKTLALSHFDQFLTDLEENGVRICDKNVMIEKIGKKYHIYGQVEVCENIARQVPTEVLEDPPKEDNKEGNSE
jgi:similar to stage IV sporulation protein